MTLPAAVKPLVGSLSNPLAALGGWIGQLAPRVVGAWHAANHLKGVMKYHFLLKKKTFFVYPPEPRTQVARVDLDLQLCTRRSILTTSTNMWARSFFPRADCNFLAPLKEYYRHANTHAKM